MQGDVGLYRRVLRELVSLRRGSGLTVAKVRQAPTLASLPIFEAISPDRRSQAVYDAIITWLREYEHPQRRAALISAFALHPETLEELAGDRFKLESRRRHLVGSGDIQNARDREDDALADLAHDWMERSIEHLRSNAANIDSARVLGLRAVTLDFYRGVEWEQLFTTATTLDIFFTYGRSWRRSLTKELTAFFLRDGVTARVVLPDLRSPNTTALPEIAKRAGQSVDTLRANIADAYGYFTENGAMIWASDAAELYAMYRLDTTLIVTLYNHQRGQSDGVPTLVCNAGTDLYDWFLLDFEKMIETPVDSGRSPLARAVPPAEARLWKEYNGRIDAEDHMADAS